LNDPTPEGKVAVGVFDFWPVGSHVHVPSHTHTHTNAHTPFPPPPPHNPPTPTTQLVTRGDKQYVIALPIDTPVVVVDDKYNALEMGFDTRLPALLPTVGSLLV
jgi:hypothetical protein